MAMLGEMLVKDKVISRKQLEEGIQSQVIFGGRLGTNLIDLGYIDEQILTKYLAKKHGVPTVEWNTLTHIKPDVLKIYTKKLAKLTESFPIKVQGKDLWVVMADPDNLGSIEQISFATGKKVKPLVLPEVRVFDLLTRFYNVGRELRYLNLAMMYQVKAKEKPRTRPDFKATPTHKAKERAEVEDKIDFKVSGDLLSEEEFQKMARGYPAPEAPEPPEAQAAPTPPPAPPEAPARTAPKPPAPPPAAPREVPAPGSPQQLRLVAQTLYSQLMKRGVQRYITKETLQEFLKVFVKSQIKGAYLPLSYLANWMIIEANAPVEWLEEALEEFKVSAPSLGLTALLPGEAMPELPTPATPPPAAPAEPAPPPVEEIVEGDELEVLEVSSEAGSYQVVELKAEDMASAQEVEEFVPAPEEEEEEEEVEEDFVDLTMDQAKQKLMNEVGDRNDISRIILSFAKGFFKRSLLFTVRGDTLFGWDGRGPDLNTKAVEAIMLGLKDPSAFQLVNLTKSFYLGPMTPTPTNERYLKLIGGGKPNNVFIMPVVVNENVVYVLYGDNGDKQFVPVNAAELQILAYQIPRALDSLIIRRKQKAKPA